MSRPSLCAFVVALVCNCVAVQADANELRVMTQNQYLGASLNAVATAPDLASANAALVAALQQVAATRFVARVGRLAEEIAERLPYLVGLQEVFALGCSSLTPGACNDPSITGAFNDHLSGTLAALANLGADYVEAATVVNVNMPNTPVDLDGDGNPDILVSFLDRDVILARDDVSTTKLAGIFMEGGLCGLPIPGFPTVSTPSADGCNYAIIAVVPTPIGPFVVERGFVAVDATVEGRTYRFVNTHLEERDPAPILQALQAFELLATLDALTPLDRSLVVVGDINSSPLDPVFLDPTFGTVAPPYQQLVLAGFSDVWLLRPGNARGFTCCELADLSNPTTLASERIDVVFSQAVPGRVRANVVGNEPSDKTRPPRLWPSDHAAVAAELRF
jgi:hypothetical protein